MSWVAVRACFPKKSLTHCEVTWGAIADNRFWNCVKAKLTSLSTFFTIMLITTSTQWAKHFSSTENMELITFSQSLLYIFIKARVQRMCSGSKPGASVANSLDWRICQILKQVVGLVMKWAAKESTVDFLVTATPMERKVSVVILSQWSWLGVLLAGMMRKLWLIVLSRLFVGHTGRALPFGLAVVDLGERTKTWCGLRSRFGRIQKNLIWTFLNPQCGAAWSMQGTSIGIVTTTKLGDASGCFTNSFSITAVALVLAHWLCQWLLWWVHSYCIVILRLGLFYWFRGTVIWLEDMMFTRRLSGHILIGEYHRVVLSQELYWLSVGAALPVCSLLYRLSWGCSGYELVQRRTYPYDPWFVFPHTAPPCRHSTR